MIKDELEIELTRIMDDVLNITEGQVVDLKILTGGASRQTWSFSYGSRSEDRPPRGYVIQLNGVVVSDELISTEKEALLLQRVAENAIPVPSVIASGVSAKLGDTSYFITTFIEGETLPARYLHSDPPLPGVAGLMSQCAKTLAAIHALPLENLCLPDYDFLDFYANQLDASEEAHPVLEWARRWLVTHRPPQRPPVLVHGDFRLGNFIVANEGLRAILDWELAHFGSPLEDVAWPLVRAWRFDHVRPKGVFPEREAWIDAYVDASGLSLDNGEVRWWEVASTFKWAIICMNQWQRHYSHATRSVELAAIGRRVVESEFDLLRLLA
jgi:aminoglycoside phosphotransferase (APT) family kinase protein